MSNRQSRVVLLGALLGALVAGVSLAHAQRGFRRQSADLVITDTPYDGRFQFARLKFETAPGGFYYIGLPAWAHGYPRGENNLARILKEISRMPLLHLEASNVIALDDPALGKYPVAYMADPDYWTMSDPEATALRGYLLKGGFVIFDDFRDDSRNGMTAWATFEQQMKRIIPNARFFDLDPSFPIFHSFFEINTFNIIPQAYDKNRAILRGLFEDNDPKKRVLAMINFNTDISDFWEFANNGFYLVSQHNEAYKLGVNYV
ncbi:MAG: DUF4159 domain-containing protein, partial [Gemmatimonadaceae bacterium]